MLHMCDGVMAVIRDVMAVTLLQRNGEESEEVVEKYGLLWGTKSRVSDGSHT